MSRIIRNIGLSFLFIFSIFFTDYLPAQNDSAESIVSKTDEVFSRRNGLYTGRIKHIKMDESFFILDFYAKISGNKSLLSFQNKPRGLQLEVLNLLAGEKIYVCEMHARNYILKSGSDRYYDVMYTNFTYADFSGRELSKAYTSKIAGEESVGARLCYMLRLDPIFPWSAYGSLMLFVDKEDMIPLKIEFRNVSQILTKVLTVTKVARKDNQVVPIRYEMRDIRNGSLTILVLNEHDARQKYDDSIFLLENFGNLVKP